MAVQTTEVEQIQRPLMFILIHATGTEAFKEGRESKDIPMIISKSFIYQLMHNRVALKEY